ncbi:MAG: DUF6273 domain-containing protein [bacterium]|nr:DUF6273 domain-containing protein [bacterium]
MNRIRRGLFIIPFVIALFACDNKNNKTNKDNSTTTVESTTTSKNTTTESTTTVNNNILDKFNVTFVDYDGSIIKEAKSYDSGTKSNLIEMPSNPTKESDNTYTYEFSGWSPNIEDVTRDITYTATYNNKYIDYTVTFFDDDKTTILKSSTYHYGDEVVPPTDPTKSQTNDSVYAFNGWNNLVVNCDGNAEYYATYTKTDRLYVINFVDDDGTTIISTKSDYRYGETVVPPINPKKATTSEYYYTFSGWDETVSECVEDMTYKATYTTTPYNGEVPIRVGNNIAYGLYPQSRVTDELLISSLNECASNDQENELGWYLYNGRYYVYKECTPYKIRQTTFDDGTSITRGNSCWFICEPIIWQCYSSDSDSVSLVSTVLLDTYTFYDDGASGTKEDRTIMDKTVYDNNYQYSMLRAWLNNYYESNYFYGHGFIDTAFALGSDALMEVLVDNSSNSSNTYDYEDWNNIYACDNTNDKIYILSIRDYTRSDSIFEYPNKKGCIATEYARAMGACCNINGYYGEYWTRSPRYDEYEEEISDRVVIISGENAANYTVTHSKNCCIRPACTISLESIN